MRPYSRYGECIRCGRCCGGFCEHFYWIANEEIAQGTLIQETGIGKLLMGGCELFGLEERPINCGVFPSEPTQIRGRCGFNFVDSQNRSIRRKTFDDPLTVWLKNPVSRKRKETPGVKRVGSCLKCGRCCRWDCTYFFWVANRDIQKDEKFKVFGTDQPLMAGCSLPLEKKKLLSCYYFPEIPIQVSAAHCRGYQFVKVKT